MVHKDKSCVRNDNLQNFKEIIQWDNFQKAVWNANLQNLKKLASTTIYKKFSKMVNAPV